MNKAMNGLTNRIRVFNPYNEEAIKEMNLISREEALKKLNESHRIYTHREKWLKPVQRIEILEKALQLLKKKTEDLVLQATSEGGKPFTDSKVEIARGLEGIKVAIHEISHLTGREIPMGITSSSLHRRAFTLREPRGVVFAISAFNHPFNLIVHQVIPAIATGCPVLVKPSLATPLSCLNLVQSLYEAGLPTPYCQVLLCEDKVAEEIVGNKKIGFFSFIGSAKVGWYLRSRLAEGASCALEHGGAAPVILDKSADLGEAIPLLIKGGFYHAGQVCVSVQRIYIEQGMEKDFIDPFVDGVKKLKVGNPLSKETQIGPLIFPIEVDRVHRWVKEAIQKGAKLLCGGHKISKTCYAPTVLLNPPQDCTLSQKEVFGPVVLIYTYEKIEEALTRANSLDASFQASIFTQKLDQAWEVAQKLKGLTIMINDHTAFRVDWMPFGGHEQSGLGVGGIPYTMHEMTLEKMLVFRSKVL